MRAHAEFPLTIEDLEAMPDDGNRYELIEGELFVSPAPSLGHQRDAPDLVMKFFHRARKIRSEIVITN